MTQGTTRRRLYVTPGSPRVREARDEYLAALGKSREMEKRFRKMLSPENVGAREMMFRVEGRGPYVTHKIPITEDGQIDARNLEKGKIYEVEDGRYFQFDEDGEDFVEMRRLGKTDEHGRAFAPIPDQQSTSLTADLRASQGGYGPSIVPQPLKLTDKFGNILPPNEIEVAAKTLAEQAGRGGYQATVIGTRAREAAEFKRRLDEALSSASRSGIDPNRDPAILRLKNAYRRELNYLRYLRDELLVEIKPEMVSIEEMAERQDDPARLENAANSAVQGGGEVFASIPIFIAVTNASRDHRVNMFWDKIDSWDEVDSEKQFVDLITNPSNRLSLIEFLKIKQFFFSNREEREKMRKNLPVPDPRTSRLYRWGMDLRESLEEEFETNPRYADEFFATKLPTALGETITESAIVAGAQIIGIPAPVSDAVLGMMTESSGLFLEALENGMPLDEAYQEFGFGSLVGMTKGIPIADFLGGIENKEAESKIRAALIKAAIGGTQEAAVKGVSQVRTIMENYGVADIEEISAAFTAESVKEFALAMINPGR